MANANGKDGLCSVAVHQKLEEENLDLRRVLLSKPPAERVHCMRRMELRKLVIGPENPELPDVDVELASVVMIENLRKGIAAFRLRVAELEAARLKAMQELERIKSQCKCAFLAAEGSAAAHVSEECLEQSPSAIVVQEPKSTPQPAKPSSSPHPALHQSPESGIISQRTSILGQSESTNDSVPSPHLQSNNTFEPLNKCPSPLNLPTGSAVSAQINSILTASSLLHQFSRQQRISQRPSAAATKVPDVPIPIGLAPQISVELDLRPDVCPINHDQSRSRHAGAQEARHGSAEDSPDGVAPNNRDSMVVGAGVSHRPAPGTHSSEATARSSTQSSSSATPRLSSQDSPPAPVGVSQEQSYLSNLPFSLPLPQTVPRATAEVPPPSALPGGAYPCPSFALPRSHSSTSIPGSLHAISISSSAGSRSRSSTLDSRASQPPKRDASSGAKRRPRWALPVSAASPKSRQPRIVEATRGTGHGAEGSMAPGSNSRTESDDDLVAPPTAREPAPKAPSPAENLSSIEEDVQCDPAADAIGVALASVDSAAGVPPERPASPMNEDVGNATSDLPLPLGDPGPPAGETVRRSITPTDMNVKRVRSLSARASSSAPLKPGLVLETQQAATVEAQIPTPTAEDIVDISCTARKRSLSPRPGVDGSAGQSTGGQQASMPPFILRDENTPLTPERGGLLPPADIHERSAKKRRVSVVLIASDAQSAVEEPSFEVETSERSSAAGNSPSITARQKRSRPPKKRLQVSFPPPLSTEQNLDLVYHPEDGLYKCRICSVLNASVVATFPADVTNDTLMQHCADAADEHPRWLQSLMALCPQDAENLRRQFKRPTGDRASSKGGAL